MAGKDWGADRLMLQRMYKALILSKLNYGVQFYSSAAKTSLKKLDSIQNTALRVITGARNTSPILSLEAETNIVPLQIERDKEILSYYNRFRTLPDSLWVKKELLLHLDNNMNQEWSQNIPAPFIVRAKQLIQNNNLQVLKTINLPIVEPRPPWKMIIDVDDSMTEYPVKMLPNGSVQNIYRQKMQDYENYIKVFTDGSRIESDNQRSTSAAMVVEMEHNRIEKWKLPVSMSVYSAEMFAIKMAMEWCVGQNIEKVLVVTDSLSSVETIKNLASDKVTVRKHEIMVVLEKLRTMRKQIKFFWVPSHCGIQGNELADREAKMAANLNFITVPQVSILEGKTMIKQKIACKWETYWHTETQRLNMGNHIKLVRETVGEWPWCYIPRNRKLETMLARLRIGHCGLRYHMNRFGMVVSPLCECGELETVHHYLLECSEYREIRRNLVRDLSRIGVQCTLKNILGGGNYKRETQVVISQLVWQYIVESGRSNEI